MLFVLLVKMNSRERMVVSLKTGISLMTIVKWDKGKKVIPSNEIALADAIRELGFDRAVEPETVKK